MLMTLVAMAAVVLGGLRARQHYLRCVRMAAVHRTARDGEKVTEAVYSRSLRFFGEEARVDSAKGMRGMAAEAESIAGSYRMRLSLLRESSNYRRRMEGKYRRAAFRPWEHIPPDPPPPDPDESSSFWYARGDYARALAACREALEINPRYGGPLNLRAWILATCPLARYRDGKAAIESATRACRLGNWIFEEYVDTLAAAYAESGDFDEAMKWQRKALELSPADHPGRSAMLGRLELYRTGRPYRDQPESRRVVIE